MKHKTTDLNYSYNRTTGVKNNQLMFKYTYDLNKEITDADIADMILYTCQRDVDLQRIMKSHESDEEMTVKTLLSIANEYRIFLLSDK